MHWAALGGWVGGLGWVEACNEAGHTTISMLPPLLPPLLLLLQEAVKHTQYKLPPPLLTFRCPGTACLPLVLLLLQEAVKHTQYDRLKDGQGKPPGLMGFWPSKACTFVDNHDTGSTQQVGLGECRGVGLGSAGSQPAGHMCLLCKEL